MFIMCVYEFHRRSSGCPGTLGTWFLVGYYQGRVVDPPVRTGGVGLRSDRLSLMVPDSHLGTRRRVLDGRCGT